ncbi:MAG: hypothetical protein ACLFQK_03605 [Fibrobacterota bacterium]
MRKIFNIFLLLAFTAVVLPLYGGNSNAALKSALVPGMGQLGEGYQFKGLGFMGAFFLSAHSVFDAYGRESAAARESVVLSEKFYSESSREMQQSILPEWRAAEERADDEKTRKMVFIGVSGALWAASIADAYLFTVPADESVSAAPAAGLAFSPAPDGGFLKLFRSF